MNYLLDSEQLIDISNHMNLVNLRAILYEYDEYSIVLNTLYHKSSIDRDKIEEAISVIKNTEFKGLELVFSNEIDHKNKIIDVWVTPIVLSA